MIRSWWMVGLLTLAVNSVEAAKVVEYASLTTADALKVAKVALQACRNKGYKVSVAVVDGAGHLKVLLRDDGAGPHTVDSSRRKAYTALSLRRPTHELAQLVVKNPQIRALGRMNDDILLLGGGLPIHADGRIVGGVGVGGAPGAMLDVACARAGIRALQRN